MPKWPMGLSHQRLNTEGWTRQQNAAEMPIAQSSFEDPPLLNEFRPCLGEAQGSIYCNEEAQISICFLAIQLMNFMMSGLIV